MAAAKRLYLESLRVGDELPILTKPSIERVQLARFAGASGDFNPMHLDEQAARAAGMPTVFAPALLADTFMAQFLTEWLKGGRLTRLALRFVKLLWPGDVLSCKGRVLARRRDDEGRYFVEVDIWAENQKGELVLKGHATGQVLFNAEDESRQKRGEAPLMAEVSEQTELARNSKGKPVRPKGSPTRSASRRKPAAEAAEADFEDDDEDEDDAEADDEGGEEQTPEPAGDQPARAAKPARRAAGPAPAKATRG